MTMPVRLDKRVPKGAFAAISPNGVPAHVQPGAGGV